MAAHLLPADYITAPSNTPKQALRFLKEAGAALGLLILANILVLGVVGVLKGSGMPKSVATPLQLTYLPLMWVGLRFLKRKYGITSALRTLPLAGVAGRALGALGLVGGSAATIIALLHLHYGLGIAFELLTTSGYQWLVMGLVLGATAAVEELVFRDYLLHSALKVTSNFFAVTAVNAALFVLLHIQGFFIGDYTLLWGLAIFSIGFFLVAYVMVFKDLIFPICFHALWNISSTLYVENDKRFNLVKFDHYALHELLISDVTAAVCICCTLGLFAVLAYRYHHQPTISR
jgi:membrane protease YdiL (CAAX protease family)